ncbi:MAG: fumarylacetoacetase [Bacteroidetes bacterium]|nr:fumarylacetoacetase [Bacteroidota bacterium]MCW5896846.1 fumarylacetoacetase [Bacteroidota bacterium]
MNETHNPRLTSWIPSANIPGNDFPIQNLPFGVFRKKVTGLHHVGVAIGDQAVDITAARNEGVFTGLAEEAAEACSGDTLNRLLSLGRTHWSELRKRLSVLLSDTEERGTIERCLVPLTAVDMQLPVAVGDYTDFYASIYHATNVGSMFRPDNPLLPNYKHVPIGYHGRASSIVVSGTPVQRPSGQTKSDDAPAPVFGSSKQLDYELEVGFFVGPGNELSKPIPITEAERHIFGLCLVNDWSARDIQKWEYQPLGPFLSKSFATTLSPWIVTLDALEPFRCPAFARPADDPAPLPYLDSSANGMRGGVNLILEVFLRTQQMQDAKMEPFLVSHGNFRDMYWTIGQMLIHHTSNGCNLRPGDLLASGTVSGPTKESRGCLLERTWRGTEPLSLPTGETRRFLEDGDEVTIRGYCVQPGCVRIGFGECRGRTVT